MAFPHAKGRLQKGLFNLTFSRHLEVQIAKKVSASVMTVSRDLMPETYFYDLRATNYELFFDL